jgi:hypothetical protein
MNREVSWKTLIGFKKNKYTVSRIFILHKIVDYDKILLLIN